MSKYTTEVRFICEQKAGLFENAGQLNVNKILQKSAPKIFNFDFPIFDEDYRLTLEIKILKHFYTREIGAETVGLWQMWLDERMNLIMPYYNEKYLLKMEALKNKSKLFNDTDITTTRKIDDNGNTISTGNVQNTGKVKDIVNANDSRNFTDKNINKNAYNNTPQGGLTNTENLRYLTDYRYIDDNLTHTETGNNAQTSTSETAGNTESTGNTTVTNTQEFIERVTGKAGGKDYFTMYKDVYDSLVNIDMEIIIELNDLFFGLWE